MASSQWSERNPQWSGLTLRSTRRPTAGFARLRPRVNSFVRHIVAIARTVLLLLIAWLLGTLATYALFSLIAWSIGQQDSGIHSDAAVVLLALPVAWAAAFWLLYRSRVLRRE